MCGDTNNGFVAIWNYGRLGEGQGEFTAAVYDNGAEFARSTFTTYAFTDSFGVYPEGYSEFMRGAFGTCVVEKFHLHEENPQMFMWNETTQHMEMVDTSYSLGGYPNGRLEGEGGSWRSVATVYGVGDHRQCRYFGTSGERGHDSREEARRAAIATCEAFNQCPEDTVNLAAGKCQPSITWATAHGASPVCVAVLDCHFRDFDQDVAQVVVALGATAAHAEERARTLCSDSEIYGYGEGYLPATRIVHTECPPG